MSLRKKLLLALFVLALAGLVLWSFRPQPISVSVATVERGPLQVILEVEGLTRVRERYELSAPVNAYMPRHDWEVGDRVEQGQVLLALRPVPPELLDDRSRARARAAVAETEATYELARKELNRIRTLYQRGDVAESALNEAQAGAERARANLAASRALLEYAGGQTDGEPPQAVSLRSPVAGQILSLARESAGTVPAGSVLLTVGDAAALEVAVDVLSADAVKLRPGMRVQLTRWGGEDILEARVRTIEPSAFTKISALGVEEQRVWVISDITSPREQWTQLGDQYRVEAGFIVWEGDDVLQAPASAVFRDGDGWAAFVVNESHAEKRPVRIGHRAELRVEILDGLAPGEQIITHPDTDLSDGAPVRQRDQPQR